MKVKERQELIWERDAEGEGEGKGEGVEEEESENMLVEEG